MQPLDGLCIGEPFQLFVHGVAEKPERMGDTPSEDDGLRIVGIERQHDQLPDMRSELLPQLQRPGIAGQGPFISLLARRAAADEKAAAAIVFVIAVQIGDAPDLPGARVAPTPVPSAMQTTSRYPCASPKRQTPSAKQLQSLLTETGTPKRFSKRSLRCTSRQEGMPTTS